MVRISDISGEVLDSGSGARVTIRYMDGRPPEELDLSDEQVGELLAKRATKPRGTTLEERRKHHPRAYERWSADEDARLQRLYEEGLNPKDIATALARHPGGIRSRLLKLGLIHT
jgi:hypothetical protein